MPIAEVLRQVVRRDRAIGGELIGSAIAFRLFLYFIPFLLFVVRLVGVVSSPDGSTLTRSAEQSGALDGQVRASLEPPGRTRFLALITCLLVMLWAARALSRALVVASRIAWRLPADRRATMRVVGTLAGIVSAIALVAIVVNGIYANRGLAVSCVSFVVAFACYSAAWFAVLVFLPGRPASPIALVPGAVLVAATLSAMQAASGLYLNSRYVQASHLYGALGATIVTLGWFFLVGRALTFGMALNAVIWDRVGAVQV
jgi:uncharacterized BrkB/YihY/UPF0761 family membrane protein